MARWGSDPDVKAWMKEHEAEVERIEKLYTLLRAMEFEGLEELAHDVGVDVTKHWTRFKDNLITDIIKTAPEKALEIVLGQGVLLQAKEGSPNKRDN